MLYYEHAELLLAALSDGLALSGDLRGAPLDDQAVSLLSCSRKYYHHEQAYYPDKQKSPLE